MLIKHCKHNKVDLKELILTFILIYYLIIIIFPYNYNFFLIM